MLNPIDAVQKTGYYARVAFVCCRLREGTMHDSWQSVDQIAEYLGVSRDTVYTWVTTKGMPGHKVGRFWKFKKEDVDEWIRAGGAASPSGEICDGEHTNA